MAWLYNLYCLTTVIILPVLFFLCKYFSKKSFLLKKNILIENNYWTKQESCERQETEDNTPPHARTPPCPCILKKYSSYIILMGEAHSCEYYGRSPLVICFLSLIVLDYLTPRKNFQKIKYPPPSTNNILDR